MSTRRRAPGEGGVYPYQTATKGTLFYFKCVVPDPLTGGKKPITRRGFTTKTEAGKEMRKVLAAADAGTYAEPSKITLGAYLADWLDGLRRKPGTIAVYRKTVRLHVAPYLGRISLASLTSTKIAALYRRLETEGRKDGKPGGLKASTVQGVHHMLHSALADAVRAGLLTANPADSNKSKPPTASEAKAPEMTVWSAEELRRFLTWSRANGDPNYVLWLVAASTGCRRGELAALRWKDIDLEAARISVRRTVVEVRQPGKQEERWETTPKSHFARVVDVDPVTVAALMAWRKALGEISLVSRAPGALVFGSPDGELRSLDPISTTWKTAVRRYNRQHPDAPLPTLRLHDLRHTHATLLLAKGTPIKVVSERLGHANVQITLSVYAHVTPGMQKAAADTWGAMINEKSDDAAAA